MRIRRRTPFARVSWPNLVWVLIGIETLVVLWFQFSHTSIERSLDLHLWYQTVLFGSPGGNIGFVRVLLAVNVVAALALWVAYRSARRSDVASVTPTLAATLLAAFVLAAIGWWGVKAQERFGRLEIRAVYELQPNGGYTVQARSGSQWGVERFEPPLESGDGLGASDPSPYGERGIDIDEATGLPSWDGGSVEFDWAIQALRGIESASDDSPSA